MASRPGPSRPGCTGQVSFASAVHRRGVGAGVRPRRAEQGRCKGTRWNRVALIVAPAALALLTAAGALALGYIVAAAFANDVEAAETFDSGSVTEDVDEDPWRSRLSWPLAVE